ncbi:hypothetical protein [Alkalibacillus almallahensis]|uniref:hypothetical protein n=1 Tax=Alkalibacillus almallahensis TaxID=1379154 RepID=UPI0014225C8D|nr:hypothetical protein [Alkalibacillus almallahensis]NIK13062.1 hypothetical protein [Alkalibacillus almallahensis]
MNVMALLVLLLLLAISLALGLTMEKLQKTSWFRSRFLMIYIACLAVGFAAYFMFVAPSQGELGEQSQLLTAEEVNEAVDKQDMSILEDLVLAGEWSVSLDESLRLEPINGGLNTRGYLVVNENDTLSNQASVKLYRPRSLSAFDRKFFVEPSIDATINEGQIQFAEEKLEAEYMTLGQSLFLERYNGKSDRNDIGLGMINYSILIVEVPSNVNVENKLNLKLVKQD